MTSNLHAVVPEPLSAEELHSVISHDPPSAPILPTSSAPTPRSWYHRVIASLIWTQKYSAYAFSVFSTLHLTTMVVAPLVSIPLANDILSMARAVYFSPGMETTLIWGSVPVHVLLGLAVRLLRKWHTRDQQKTNPPLETNPSLPDSMGSTGLGGISSFLGLGERRSWVSRTLGLTPLQFSGYLLVPLVLTHGFLERGVPLLVDGDSSLIDLSFISHILNRPGPVYTFMVGFVWLFSYHMTTGWMKYLLVWSPRAKRMAYALITGLTALATLSLYRLKAEGLASGFLGAKFDQYATFFE